MTGETPDDIDMATDALPEQVMETFRKVYYKDSFVKVVPTGLSHGTVTLVIDGFPVEVTTLRVDKKTDGRHADVEFTSSWRDDAARRDFTINAMSMDIDGTVYDYFDGAQDLKDKVVKFVGDPDTRIKEDYLRILRYFRFSSRIGVGSFSIEGKPDLKACFNNLDGLETISGERIWKELMKTFSSEFRTGVVSVMWAGGFLDPCGFGVVEPNYVYECLSLKENARSSLYYIAALTQTVERLDALRERLKFDSNSYDTVYFLVSKIYEERVVVTPEWIREQFARGTRVTLLKHLAYFVGDEEVMAAVTVLADNPPPPFPVTGKDILGVGVKPGPDVGRNLTELREKWIESGYAATREELLKEVKVLHD
jgi:hypothetical protein